MKPTVSDRMTSRPLGSAARRAVGSSVSNSLRARRGAARGQRARRAPAPLRSRRACATRGARVHGREEQHASVQG